MNQEQVALLDGSDALCTLIATLSTRDDVVRVSSNLSDTYRLRAAVLHPVWLADHPDALVRRDVAATTTSTDLLDRLTSDHDSRVAYAAHQRWLELLHTSGPLDPDHTH